VVLAVDGVREAHAIRSRGTADHVQVDLHIHLDGAMRLDEAHHKTHEVADAIRRAFPLVRDVVIHTEPCKETRTREMGSGG
jgi:divalent metal cation (Fe/Co/Zn/Cd) transporter